MSADEIPDDVIIPPPAIKEIILKTATYVHRNGKEFETKIRENESNNNKFTFVNENDPYNKYYNFVLDNIETFIEVSGENGSADAEEQHEDEQVEPPLELDFLVELPPITSKDLEIIKLTALFVAKNGENYINQIKNKYKDQTAQFSFLNDSHSFHQLFLSFLKQYRKLINSKEDIDLDHDVLEESYKRAKFNELNKINTVKSKELEEAKKLKYASIDWQDFIVVETINITDIDSHTEFPLPLTIADLQYRSLEQKSQDISIPSVTPIADTKETSAKPMKIRSYGETRLKRGQQSQGEKLVECPITGKLIPESNFERHMQILLRDPKYKQEKLNYESKIKNSNLSTSEVVNNIKNLFKPKNNGDRENSTKRQKVQWDGYQSSVNFVKQTNHNDGLSNDEVEELKRKRQELENKIGPSRQ
ncbi:hypothetical protein WICANDRAFT_75853 [Wickerhamomyces anomalus NRRL Y-366-8]|uniref:SURP motif domain-containing protein n=1 Tax=Wickerhamomyces anomalus (strain ATCC 58044 / CBS 1984 / NCYC 433 / NRRL Y-366-8) TaxID=683960 RepID=A0A1E3P9T6_WICAA|nr:uncharacterized protein WICANDRAFT_75853 [Wickerhamomyces anomalus NRRL Y-366-8]ODQ61647.1 hypothetical protein WICANDRAFT_75853 [Wickerhamomyces anomalus NRRL Y-366-8]